MPTQTRAVRSLVDGSLVGYVHEFTPAEVDTVLTACAPEQPRWGARPVNHRADLLHRFADLLEEHAPALADLLVMEIAKARKDAVDEVVRSAEFARHTAEEAKRVVGESQFSDTFPGQRRNKLAVTHRVPLGTILAIPPFNYPVNLSVSKVAPRLATGDAVVLKPPSQGALAAVLMTHLAHAAGIPVGVLHVVTGPGSTIGDYLVRHPAINLITFTGSSETGRRIAHEAGMVPLLLELGGKDAAIVLPDADLEAAAADIVAGAFAYSGQRCTAVKRVLAVKAIADPLVNLLGARVDQLTVGDPRDDSTITPLVDPEAAAGAEQLIAQSLDKGAPLVRGGGRQGSLVEPTLLDHVTAEMDVAWVEPFAPVLPVIRVDSAGDAVRLANRSEYGLQAALFCRDLDADIQVAARLDVGTVQVNGRTARGPDRFPSSAKSSRMGHRGYGTASKPRPGSNPW